MLCVVGHAGALTRRAGPSTDHSNPNTNCNVSIYFSIHLRFQTLSLPLPPPPPPLCAGRRRGQMGQGASCYFALGHWSFSLCTARELNASFVCCAQVVLFLIFVGLWESTLWYSVSHGKMTIFLTLTAATVAFRSHISLFLLLSFLWVLFLIPWNARRYAKYEWIVCVSRRECFNLVQSVILENNKRRNNELTVCGLPLKRKVGQFRICLILTKRIPPTHWVTCECRLFLFTLVWPYKSFHLRTR